VKVEPGARDLLEAARAALASDVIPRLSPDERYAALMAANALAIALRELDAKDASAAELGRIAALLGDADCGPLGRAQRTLVARIREGCFDAGEARAALLEHLEATTRDRLSVSNPKALRPPPEKS
jgi:hypothetical protein